MATPDFDSLPITTMTLVVPFTGEVNLDTASDFLHAVGSTAAPGEIITIRYKGKTRGVPKTSNYFKNSIMIDLRISEKNVSIKLSRTNIQMCGAKSTLQGEEGAKYIRDMLLHLQSLLDDCTAYPEETTQVILWILNHVRQGTVPVALESTRPLLAAFLIQRLARWSTYDEVVEDFKRILGIPRVISPDFDLQPVSEVMTNINFDLGFRINRRTLTHLVNVYGEKFYANFDNAINHNVTLEYPLNSELASCIRRRNKALRCVFLVYASGLITLSGPGKQYMREPYYAFYTMIKAMREEVLLPDYETGTRRRRPRARSQIETAVA